ncbi:galactosyltransferase-related protein [Undibacterium arcticum]|uniref:Galactosyltransferase-related protein n=1 Tax=Undibacterium arcticum TaxID=1762892 RepID=A0ABV7FBZ4_9BURK
MADMTALIPLDLARRPKQLFQRVNKLVSTLTNAGIRVVVSHNDRCTRWDEKLKSAAKLLWGTNAILASGHLYDGLSNNAILRNHGFGEIKTNFLLLLDADIFPDTNLFFELFNSVHELKEPFAMAPCLYLTNNGSNKIQRENRPKELIEAYLNFQKQLTQHLASPSSVMVLWSTDFADIGGFNEAYSGHSYEDFDFMIRLALKKNVISFSQEMLVDKPYRAPLLAEGFRAMLSPLCFNWILKKKFALHLHHAKNRDEKYYSKRSDNSYLFNKKMRAMLDGNQENLSHKSPLWLANMFFETCYLYETDSSEFFALLDARPDFLDRGGRIWRSTRRSLRIIRNFFS